MTAEKRTRLTLDLALGKKIVSANPSEIPTEHGDDRYRVTVPIERDEVFFVRVNP